MPTICHTSAQQVTQSPQKYTRPPTSCSEARAHRKILFAMGERFEAGRQLATVGGGLFARRSSPSFALEAPQEDDGKSRCVE